MKSLPGVCLLLLLVGCGGHRPPADDSPVPYQEATTRSDDQGEANAVAASEEPREQHGRLIVSTAGLRVESLTPDSIHHAVTLMALEFDGCVLGSDNDRTTIRIPAEHFHDAIFQIEAMGRVVKKSIEAQDVTDDCRYFQDRLENALKSRQRNLELLAQAKGMDQIFRAEQELQRINRKIQRLNTRINGLSHLTLYSTIEARTKKKGNTEPVGWLFVSAAKGIVRLF